jgi:hypothetical protein
LFLPATGYRSHRDGSLDDGGSGGYYWSSTANSNADYANGYGLIFGSGYVLPANGYDRAYGMSVRCVAD